jgi:nitrogen fixation NifU-like protein
MNAMDAADSGYSATVWEHFRRPRNTGVFSPDISEVVEGHAGDRRHGREIHLALRMEEERVVECRYQVYGCPATVAVCSVLSERARGATLAELPAMAGLRLAEELELPPTKRAAALLLEDALTAALARYNRTSRLETA